MLHAKKWRLTLKGSVNARRLAFYTEYISQYESMLHTTTILNNLLLRLIEPFRTSHC